MALPLKSGADLYTQELLRARLHNYDGDLSEYGVGSIYFNTTSGLNTSDRIRYRGLARWHSVANLEDIARLEDIINSLDFAGSEDFTGLVDRVKTAEGDIDTLEGKVKTIEDDYLTASDKKELSDALSTLNGYFTNGVANDAAKLGGQLPSYYAQSSALSQLRTEFDALYKTLNDDTTGVINTWQEVVDFVNEYSGSEDLSTILAGMNTQIENRYTKGEIDTKLLAYRLLTNGVFDVLIDANKGITTDEITIGGIKLSVVDGQLCIEGDAFATGQLSSGGVGEEGGSEGVGGLVVLDDWDKYDASLNQVVGASLGIGLRDRIVAAEGTLSTHTSNIASLGSRIDALASKATNVSVAQTLTSGKEIGAITIDGVATKLYAPATYAWGEITSKPTSLAGYGITDAVRYNKWITIDSDPLNEIGYGQTGNGWPANGPALSIGYSSMYAFQMQMDLFYANLLYRFKTDGTEYKPWRKILDEMNYASVLDNAYLKLSGGTITGGIGALNIKRNADSSGSFIAYSNNTWTLGYLGVNSSFEPSFTKDGSAYHTLLHKGNYESIVGDKFLKLSGGTISASNNNTIILNNTSGTATWSGVLTFANNGQQYGRLLMGSKDGHLMLTNSGWTATYAILDDANFNTYAPTLTGVGASGTWGIDITGSAAKLNNRSASQFVQNDYLVSTSDAYVDVSTCSTTKVVSDYRWKNIPDAPDTGTTVIGSLFNLAYSVDWIGQMFFSYGIDNNIKYRRRYNGNTWSDWKTLAFTDSDITGNAASATKLATARSFWGNLFDGTGDVTGGIAFNSVQKISWNSNADSYYIRSSVFTGATNPSLEFCAWGGHYFSSQGVTRLIINQAGNVSIGAEDLAGDKYRLLVDGVFKVREKTSARLYTRIANAGVQIGRNSSLYTGGYNGGLSFGEDESVLGYIAGMYNERDLGYTWFFYGGTSYNDAAITISGIDGNVGIGTGVGTAYKLDVNGTFRASGVATLSSRLIVGPLSDDGSSTLQVYNTARFTDGALTTVIGNGRWKTYASGSWARTLSAWKSDNSAELGGFGFLVNNDVLTYLYIGTYSKPYMRIWPDSEIECLLNVNAKVGVKIPTGQTLKIGDATLSWDSTAQALKVDKDFYSDGQVSSGGVAEEGDDTTTGGSGLERVVFTIPSGTTTFDCEHNLGTREISVAIYEEGNDYQQILTDVYLDSTNIARVVFGSATDVAHKVVIIG